MYKSDSVCAASTAPRISHERLARSPLAVVYEVTRACDLESTPSRTAAQPELHPDELNPADARWLIDQVADFPDRPTLMLSGGDPLKRPDIYRLVQYATYRSLQVGVTLRATPLVSQLALRRLRNAGMTRLAIRLDGADAETHDALQGVAGSYDRTWDMIAMSKDLRIPLQINTTITPANFEQIDVLADQLAGPQIVLWSVCFPVPVGRAAFSPRITADQYEEAFAKLWRHSRQQPYFIKTTEAPHYRRFILDTLLHAEWREVLAAVDRRNLLPRLTRGINDAQGTIFVSHAGLIHPNEFLPIVCGMFPADHLVDVYQKSDVFRELRDVERLKGKCKICEYRHVCGGSRARAYATSGDLFAQEPDCNYLPTTCST